MFHKAQKFTGWSLPIHIDETTYEPNSTPTPIVYLRPKLGPTYYSFPISVFKTDLDRLNNSSQKSI